MNTSQLKRYAPAARRDFIAAVTAQAARLGITAKGNAPAKIEGDVLLVAGQAFPKAIEPARTRLLRRVLQQGFGQTMEAIAYTWFNRLAAIRYMEIHGYLEHGYRVLSHPEGKGRPEILDHAADVDLPGLDRAKAIELKLDGTKDDELYRLLLLAQCDALHKAMPFLFERIGDETELLLPAGLLHTDSLIRQMVEEIDEELWQDIEIIGWLYQFYISEKKDEVIGKVVKSEDIPAATQLFTPNWIVKYMVQNSLGAQWLATYPDSPLKGQMEYYIEPAEQTEEVQAQLAEITPSSLDPENLTLMDPACGSGHILVEAYELFKAIYLERGYRLQDVPKLILENNLFGLDIDERAAQLSGFALMMKGRADDRRLFGREVKLNVMALVDSAGFDAEGLADGVDLAEYGLEAGDLAELKQLFAHATTFGSLIQVPEELAEKLPALNQLSEVTSQDLFVSEALNRLAPLIKPAELLAAQFDTVVANPPYMGSRYMAPLVKEFVKESFVAAKSDLYACFIERTYTLAKNTGCSSLVTIQNWMFLSSFEVVRERMFRERTILTLVQVGPNSFPTMNTGKVAQAAVFSMANIHIKDFVASYTRLSTAPESADKGEVFLARRPSNQFGSSAEEFRAIPGGPVAYWVSPELRSAFQNEASIESIAPVRQGFQTGDNDRFLRYWFEVDASTCGFGFASTEAFHMSGRMYAPYNKGGDFRKWYGNNEYLVKFDTSSYRQLSQMGNRLPSRQLYFHDSITWSSLSSGNFGARYNGDGFTFSGKGACAFPGDEEAASLVINLLNSRVCSKVLEFLSPTIDFNVGAIRQIPLPIRLSIAQRTKLRESGTRNVAIGETDWNAYERSWDFQTLPLLTASPNPTPALASSYTAWITQNRATIAEMKRLEEENNRLFIDAYGLQDELTPEVPIEQITLTVNPAYRYGTKITEDEQWTRFREDTMEELVSYAIGCMMGRYSLDEPGLIYAYSGGKGFDPDRYTTFPADPDGIIPLTDTDWFEDDALHRLVEFISVAWPAEHLEENLAFLAANLSPRKNESSRETIRRYLCDSFFKSHLKTYKKRPIYWLFNSGRQKAFRCLVYLHRYNEGTLARMRSEYVIPLQGKMAARLDQLRGDIQAATSTAHRKRLEKEAAKLEKQQVELLSFDEKLRHYADRRISLDLDDGVKVNYGKFGDLLDQVKRVHGKKPASP